jgi:alpha-beta hydrolase superfamily lysophospholipase
MTSGLPDPHASIAATESWDAPTGLNPRGTLVVLPGRGEHAGLYERFGRRLAADAYQVRVLGDATADPVAGPEAVSAHLKTLLAQEKVPAPRVIVGSDTGTLLALRLVAGQAVVVDALVLVGLPDLGGTLEGTAEDEVRARASCPTHQNLLRGSDQLDFGALRADRIPEQLREPVDLGAVTVPVLALHGVDDTINPLGKARVTYQNLPQCHLVGVEDGRHDVLNALNHRSVAATVVLFLERLRLGADLPSIVHPESLSGTEQPEAP